MTDSAKAPSKGAMRLILAVSCAIYVFAIYSVGQKSWQGESAGQGYSRLYVPLDIPAIEETRKDQMNCSRSYVSTAPIDGWRHPGGGDFPTYCTDQPTFSTIWTCADKTRILEHDEQTPPKYWCRKVYP